MLISISKRELERARPRAQRCLDANTCLMFRVRVARGALLRSGTDALRAVIDRLFGSIFLWTSGS